MKYGAEEVVSALTVAGGEGGALIAAGGVFEIVIHHWVEIYFGSCW
jgi:hypothetical protein